MIMSMHVNDWIKYTQVFWRPGRSAFGTVLAMCTNVPIFQSELLPMDPTCLTFKL
jgi:hypothetical protein